LKNKDFLTFPKEAKTIVNKGFQKSTTLVTNTAYELKNRNNEIVQKIKYAFKIENKKRFLLE
jgi:hypothetical protein